MRAGAVTVGSESLHEFQQKIGKSHKKGRYVTAGGILSLICFRSSDGSSSFDVGWGAVARD